MNTGYTPEQGRGFVRPGETKKPCYRVFSGIKKAAPIRNRLSEQLTCCEKNGSVQGNYINRVVKRHYCRITGKTKATAKGSPVGTRENKSITNNATFAAGGQSVRFTPMTLGLTEGHYGECAGLLVGYQPLGSIPRRFSSARPNSLSQLARLMPSLCASLSNCSFSSGEIRILNCGDCPSPLGLLSRLIVDKWSPIELAFLLLGGHLNTGTLKKAKPEGARNTNGLLTTNDNDSIEVAMRNYTRHPQGRDSYNLNKYIWRFIALSTAQPRVITIEATSEQEARQQSPAGCVMVFAARIRQGVGHVQ
ncbi:putative icd-like protein [Escherichia coli 2-011-08_S1_C1]|nr:putative icd-like protein [Escherichia coli 2-011-08_S1_C1]